MIRNNISTSTYVGWTQYELNDVITMRLPEIIMLSSATMMMCFNAHAYSGHTDANSYHAGSQPYHCHNGNGSGSQQRAGQDSGGSDSKLNEDAYNVAFCVSVGGRTKARHTYTYLGNSSYVKVGCETDTYVYKDGLDKYSSLDSDQQALFFSYLTGVRTCGGDL